MSAYIKKIKYLLVIVDTNDPFELPLYVCDTLPQCAEYLGCSVKTLYNYKRYNNFEILFVKDVENEI